MEISLTIVIFVLLFIVGIIDFCIKKIPSVLLTSMIFLIAIVNMFNVTFGVIHLAFGICAFIFAYLLYEFRFIGGVADIKVIIMIGMLVKNLNAFLIMILLIVFLGVIYKLYYRFIVFRKKTKNVLIPFIPCLLLVYLILMLLGGLIA